MKKLFFCILVCCVCAPVFSQDDDVFSSSSKERDTIFAVVPVPMLSVGISGGIAFISPEKVNNQIEYNNSSYNSDEFPITRPGQWGLWVSYRPKNLSTFFTLRAEMLSSSRAYTFLTNITQPQSPTVISTVASTAKYHYSLYPFSIGTGSVLYKTIAKAEIGFIYALARITQETSVPGYTSSETTYEGEGYGFRINLQQVIPIERTLGGTIEIGYRYIIVTEFRDARGVSIKNTEMDYSGINLSVGLSYGF